MLFPDSRGRRLRATSNFRRMIRETKLSCDDLILPLFAIEGKNVKKPIESMPGHFQLSCDHIVKKAKQALKDAKLNLTRIEKLYKRQVFSERQHETAENDYLQAVSDYDVCRLELLDAKSNLNDMTLRAPFSGIVEKVLVEEGSSLYIVIVTFHD